MTVAAIHRKAGTSRLNSRVSELRKQGYEIEHETVPEKTGSLGHKYRLLNPPSQTELARLVDLPLTGDWEGRRAEVPRDETHRYRIYRMVYDELDLLATATTSGDVGTAIVTLGLEGEFDHSCVGILDTHGTDAAKGTWVINPWDSTP